MLRDRPLFLIACSFTLTTALSLRAYEQNPEKHGSISSAPPIASAPSDASKLKVPEGVEYRPDVVYTTTPEKTELMLDLALPKGTKEAKGPLPAVVCIHGGGWVYRDRKQLLPLIWRLAQNGYVAATVSYRLAPEYQFPAQVHDVKAAVRWLRDHAKEYRIDPERIAAVGNSSGGHLACMLGVNCTKVDLEGAGVSTHQSSRVDAVAVCSPLIDLEKLYISCKTGDEVGLAQRVAMAYALRSFLGGGPEQFAERYARASPLTYAGKDSAPTLLIRGTNDRQVPLEQLTLYQKKLKDAAVEVGFLPIEGGAHDLEGAQEEQAVAATIAFLDKHLKPAKVKQQNSLDLEPDR